MLLRDLIDTYHEQDRKLCVTIRLEGKPVSYYRNLDVLGPVVLNKPVLEVKTKEYNPDEDIAVVSLD